MSIHAVPAPLWRRLTAILYDLLLLGALMMAATLPVTLIAHGTMHGIARSLFQLYLLLLIAVFFIAFWLRGGQTVGMRAWRLRVVDDLGGDVRLRQAIVRLLVAGGSWACLGLGFLWSLIDAEGRTWHDRASHTRLVVLPKRSGDAPQQIQR